MIIIYKNLILKYIHLLKPQDIKNFAFSKNQVLTDQEVSIIYSFIKSNYQDLLNKNASCFSELKKSLRPDLYSAIISLYQEYQSKI